MCFSVIILISLFFRMNLIFISYYLFNRFLMILKNFIIFIIIIIANLILNSLHNQYYVIYQ